MLTLPRGTSTLSYKCPVYTNTCAASVSLEMILYAFSTDVLVHEFLLTKLFKVLTYISSFKNPGCSQLFSSKLARDIEL